MDVKKLLESNRGIKEKIRVTLKEENACIR